MGRNDVAEEQESVLKKIAKNFWAPVPWMLEATVVFGSSSANTSKPPLSPPLLLFNVALGTFQEGRANAALSCANAAICGIRGQAWC
jgi:H+-transporting ATPase